MEPEELLKAIGSWIYQNFDHTDYMIVLILAILIDKIIIAGLIALISLFALAGIGMIYLSFIEWNGIFAFLLQIGLGSFLILVAYLFVPKQWKQKDG